MQSPLEEPEDLHVGIHLVWGSGSGPCQKIQMALYEKGLAFNSTMISFDNKDTQRAPWIARLNPRKQVPILLHDGVVITQSHAILLYLEENFPNFPLLPSSAGGIDAQLRSQALARTFEADDTIVRRMRDVVKINSGFLSATANGDASLISAAEEKMKTAIEAFGEELDIWEQYFSENSKEYPSSGWLVGPRLSLADIALFPIINMCVMRMGLRLNKRPLLHTWHERQSFPLKSLTIFI